MNYNDTFHYRRDVEFDEIIGAVARELTIEIIGHDPAGYVVDAEYNSRFFPIRDILYEHWYAGEEVEDIISNSAVDIARLVYGSKRRAKVIEATLRESVEYRMY